MKGRITKGEHAPLYQTGRMIHRVGELGVERRPAMRGVALAICLIAGGCGGGGVEPSGRDDAPTLLQNVERGTTAKDQVRALFGNAAKVDPLSMVTSSGLIRPALP